MPPPRSGAAHGKRKAVKQDQKGDKQLAHTSFEKRLELARAQRNRVIASRAPRPETETVSPTPHLAFTSKADPAPAPPQKTSATEDLNTAQAGSAPDETIAVTLPALLSTKSEPEPSPKPIAKIAPGWGRMGLVAAGCSIGLALGLALGASLTTKTEPLASTQPEVSPQPATLVSTISSENPATPALALTGITEVAAALPRPITFPDPVMTAAVPAAPSAAPPSDLPPLLPVAASFSAFWEVSEPLPSAEIAPLAVAWSTTPPPSRIELPLAPGTFDGQARLAPFEAAPVPPFSLAEDLFAPGSDLPATKLFVFAPAALSANEVDAQVATLAATGLQTANLQRIEMTISTAHLRYYTASDATVAMALAETLGVEARDFTGTVSGEPGSIEVWLAGRSGLPPRPTQAVEERDTRVFGNVIDFFKRDR